jgi:hypothetical protein
MRLSVFNNSLSRLNGGTIIGAFMNSNNPDLHSPGKKSNNENDIN